MGGRDCWASAVVVDATGGAARTSEGPYLPSTEQLGGFWIVDVPDEATALAVAERASRACRAPIEARPFQGLAD